LAENNENNLGLVNTDSATLELAGGSYTGRGGVSATGIQNSGSNSELVAKGIDAMGENSSDACSGLENLSGGIATLHGGSFTCLDGLGVGRGIYNNDDSTLNAFNVTSRGEGVGSYSFGIYIHNGAIATLHGGSFTGRGGDDSRGIYVASNDALVAANNISAAGEDATSEYGLYCSSTGSAIISNSLLEGTTQSIFSLASMMITNSRLVGGGVSGSGTNICVAVTYDTAFYENTCP
jgi:hypothetical protein